MLTEEIKRKGFEFLDNLKANGIGNLTQFIILTALSRHLGIDYNHAEQVVVEWVVNQGTVKFLVE